MGDLSYDFSNSLGAKTARKMTDSGSKVLKMSAEGLPILDRTGVQPSLDKSLSTRSPIISPWPDNATPTKPRRKLKFSPIEDLVIVREVSTSEAHVAVHGEVARKFEEAYMKLNVITSFVHTESGKTPQNRYQTLLRDFN